MRRLPWIVLSFSALSVAGCNTASYPVSGPPTPISEKETADMALYCAGMLWGLASVTATLPNPTPSVIAALNRGAGSLADTGRYGAAKYGATGPQIDGMIMGGRQAIPNATAVVQKKGQLDYCAKAADVTLQ